MKLAIVPLFFVGLVHANLMTTHDNNPYIRYVLENDHWGQGRCSATAIDEKELGVKLPEGYCTAYLTAGHCLNDALRPSALRFLVDTKQEICQNEVAGGTKAKVFTSLDENVALNAIAVFPKAYLARHLSADTAILLTECNAQLKEPIKFPLTKRIDTTNQKAIVYLPITNGPKQYSTVYGLPSVAPEANLIFTGASPNPGDSGSPVFIQATEGAYLAGVVSATTSLPNGGTGLELAAGLKSDLSDFGKKGPFALPRADIASMLDGLQCSER